MCRMKPRVLYVVVMLGKVLQTHVTKTSFGFVIFNRTKFGATIIQLVLGYILGLLTVAVAVARTFSISMSDTKGSLATGLRFPPWGAIFMPFDTFW